MLEPHPPAWQAVHDPVSWVIALVVLACIAVVVVLLSRRPDPPEHGLPAPCAGTDPAVAEKVAGLVDLEAAGEAMIDAGYSVTGVRTALTEIALVNGQPSTEIVVLPTALFVSTRNTTGLSTLVTTAATMVAIMLGILAGAAVGGRLGGRDTVTVV